jgi:DtxR family Mn-dependent transcriptional regulator
VLATIAGTGGRFRAFQRDCPAQIGKAMSEREQVEDALKCLYQAAEEGRPAGVEQVAEAAGVSGSQASALIARMLEGELIAREDDTLALTPQGRDYALQVVRAHRLYETYLAHRTGVEPERWHDRAHAAEHGLSATQVDRLDEALGHPSYDPHGDPIPTSAGVVPPRRGGPLTERTEGWAGRVVHVEDEPPDVYRRLAQTGFAPAVRIRIEASSAESMTVRLEGRDVTLSRGEAAQVTVDEMPEGERFDETIVRLSDVHPGEKAEVVGISPFIHGLARSRLLDLGFVPGTVTQIDLMGPAGDPIAYVVRGAAIALRREQSERILVRRQGGEAG